MQNLVSIKNVLLEPSKNAGWFFLPQYPWTIDTEGMFYDIDPHASPSDDNRPNIIKERGWLETLDSNLIEEVIVNAKGQLNKPSVDELFEAFAFYIINDAFIRFTV